MSFEMAPFGTLFSVPQKNGLTRPKKVRGSGLPMVNMGELFAYPRIHNLDMDLVPVSQREAHFLLEPEDLLFARQSLVLEGAGQCSIFVGNKVPTVFESHLIRCRLNKSIFNPYFYFYFFRSPIGRTAIETIAEQGAGASGIRGSDLINLDVPCPPKNFQDAVANILTALDDRITLLCETNATLEAIAQAMFKSWFVDFDPVRAKQEGRAPESMDEATAALFPDSFEESELGLVPRGWRIGILGDFLSLRNERTKPSDLTASLPYVPVESISSKSPFLQEYKSGEEANSSLILFRKGDVLFGAMRPYFHKVCSAPFDGVTRTTVFTLTPKNNLAAAFALFQAYQDTTIEYATQHSEGSTIPYAKWGGSLEKMPVVVPPKELQERYSDVVSQFIECANENLRQAQTLSTLRDTLLPRLISGQLRLPEAEGLVEALQ